ncbi:hypothetical protein TNCV_3771301 [Trichonephila clavipes]|nr:hypothetical protein TNCV_3771301 [Trichonephila clavipes]
MTKSVVSVAAIVGRKGYHTHKYRIKEVMDVFLGYSSPCGFDALQKFISCSNGWCIPGQSLCKRGPHVFNWRKIGRTSRPRKGFNLMGKEELSNISCHAWLRYHPVGIWLMASAEYMEGPRAPTPQRCITDCSVHWQCVLDGCGSEIPYHPKP